MTIKPDSRILLVTRNLPPLVGGMERLNWHMAEVRIIGPAGSERGSGAFKGCIRCAMDMRKWNRHER